MKFYEIKTRTKGKYGLEIYPDFNVRAPDDLMTKGATFYAVWDEQKGFWSQNEFDVAEIVDKELDSYSEKCKETFEDIRIMHMREFSTNSWLKYKSFINKAPDHYHSLNTKVMFADAKVKRSDYASFVLPYVMKEGPMDNYEELMNTLYSEPEREKIEWAIGSIISGDSKRIQKFIVLYGPQGTGKGTVLDIIQRLFEIDPDNKRDRYFSEFKAKSLGSDKDQFSSSAFKDNPLIAIDPDGNLSDIQDNTLINQIVSHENIIINDKGAKRYPIKPISFLFMGTNEPVKITGAKSGIIRRLIDVQPTGNRINDLNKYLSLMNGINYELGAIAAHCLKVYKDIGGASAYNDYVPRDMMYKTDPFFNFIDMKYFEYEAEDRVTLKTAYDDYKAYCESGGIKLMTRYRFQEEMGNYFENFDRVIRIGGVQYRSLYSGFKKNKFDYQKLEEREEKAEPISKAKAAAKSKAKKGWCVLKEQHSLLDDILADYPAQYAKRDKFENDIPTTSWAMCTTKLKDIDTTKVHYVKPPLNHIVIDFDIKDADGNKSKELNLEAVNKWPKTYAEYSKGGSGIHLHYIYEGDPTKLADKYSDDIEIKVYKGLLALRRRVSCCNDIPVATISSGLPLKGAKVVNEVTIKNEQHLKNKIEQNLRKECAPSTRQSIDLIFKDLQTAYDSGMEYDLSNMRKKVMLFASKSTNQAAYCIKRVADMKFVGCPSNGETVVKSDEEAPIAFYDIEIFPGSDTEEPLLLINWKFEGLEKPVIRMINPTREAVKEIFKFRLVDFNGRRYDRHILYAYVYDQYEIFDLFKLSNRLINGGKTKESRNYFYGQAYNLGYLDMYDVCSEKKGLKKWEIELNTKLRKAQSMEAKGYSVSEISKKLDISEEFLEMYRGKEIVHKELGYRWDKPVPKDKWIEVAEYCDNDVIATEALWVARKADRLARKMLSSLSGLSVNEPTNQHSIRFMFGNDKEPQREFNYRNMGEIPAGYEIFHYDLETWERVPGDDGSYSIFYEKDGHVFPIFRGYSFDHGVSTYRGEVVGEGGYVHSKPGIYWDVTLEDIASMHPHSMKAEVLFGEKYTRILSEILEARIAIKHKDFEHASQLLDGKLAPYLTDPKMAKDLAQALKIVINSIYGLTSAGFKNPFRDPRNIDNIVAKRGALFMINLKHEVQNKGYTVAHIKTDSIKVPNATQDIIDFIHKYGALYGYTFEHEAVYDRMCLVNDAVYIAKYAKDYVSEGKTPWTATGTEFQVPYVFKTLFSKEDIDFEDLCETKTVTTSIYLDMNEELPDVSAYEKEYADILKKLNKIEDQRDTIKGLTDEVARLNARKDILEEAIAKGHNYCFVGRAGLFTPVNPGCNGGELVREKDGKYSSVGGTKGYRWLESEMVRELHMEDDIDMSYYEDLALQALKDVEKYGSYQNFVADIPLKENTDIPPWDPPCGTNLYEYCVDCPKYNYSEEGCEWLCADNYKINSKGA